MRNKTTVQDFIRIEDQGKTKIIMIELSVKNIKIVKAFEVSVYVK